MMRCLLILLALIIFSGCDKDGSISIPPGNVLSASARAKLNLPPEGQLTVATKADREFVAELSSETLKGVGECLKPTRQKYEINAARPVGKYLLLWIGFPEVADGGIDLIWSVEKQRPVGTFLGGYRG